MAETPKTYERLPGTGQGLGRRVQLWLADDHLLQVAWDAQSERYKRFRFEDIRVLSIHRTIEGKVVNGVVGFLIFAIGVLATAVATSGGTSGALTFFGLLGGPLVIVLAVNILLGPWCKCRLGTAVQTEELVSLRRLRRAQKVFDRLRPRIVAAQGELSAEEIYSQLQQARTVSGATASATDQNAPPLIDAQFAAPVKPPPRHYTSKIHFIFFCVLVADLPLTIGDIFLHGTLWSTVGILFLLVSIALGISALLKQRNTDLPIVLRRIPWISLITDVVFIAASIVYGVTELIKNPDAPSTEGSFLDDPVTLVMTVISTGLSTILGAMGFIHLRRFKAADAAANVPPPVESQTS